MRIEFLFLFCFLNVLVLFSAWGGVPPITAKIVFSGNREKFEQRDIYLMNPDGKEVVNLTNHSADDVLPIFSPTGEHILFCSDRDGAPLSFDLYLMNADGSDPRRVFDKSALRITPTWSPDGKQIAYVRSELGVAHIYIAPIDGKRENRVGIGIQPAWSPDGQEIAYINRKLQHPRYITLLNLRTGRSRFLFPPDAPTWLRSPAWSRDGEKLAFTWWHPDEAEPNDFFRETLYTINRDGTGLRQLIPPAALPAVTHPVWSPIGDALIYERLGAGFEHRHIFKISVAAGQPVQLTRLTIWNSLGDWFDPSYALPVSPQPQLLTTIWAEKKKK